MKEEAVLVEKIQSWLEQLHHEEASLRLLAAAGLSRLGSRAREAVPALVACLKDPNVHVRKMAATGLGEMALPLDLVVPALIEVLADSDSSVRRRAGVALSEILAAHPEACSRVQAGLAHPNSIIRQHLLGILAASQDRRAA
jgi:HEAT repeat protein